jgi:Flp pilus assembly protein CpaB
MFGTHDRIRNLGAAAILAVFAATLAVLALPRHHAAAEAAAQPKIRALVATRDLPVGTAVAAALADGALVQKMIPLAAAASGGVENASLVRRDVVLQPVYRDEQLTTRRLGPTGAAGLRSELTGNRRILQVPGDANQLLAGTLRDGDHVDVVASIKAGSQQTPYSRIVLRDLVVLHAPDGVSQSSATGLTPTTAATLELTDRQVQELFFVMKNGDWSFILRPAARAASTIKGAVSAGTVLEGR